VYTCAKLEFNECDPTQQEDLTHKLEFETAAVSIAECLEAHAPVPMIMTGTARAHAMHVIRIRSLP